MVAPARNAIIARCRAKYGPLPNSYSPEGVWVGLPQEERARLDAEMAAKQAERGAAQEAAKAEIIRRTTIETMTREELQMAVKGFLDMRDIAQGLHDQALKRLAGEVA
jgi:hypothetical protein